MVFVPISRFYIVSERLQVLSVRTLLFYDVGVLPAREPNPRLLGHHYPLD